jgi:hypothetical protein
MNPEFAYYLFLSFVGYYDRGRRERERAREREREKRRKRENLALLPWQRFGRKDSCLEMGRRGHGTATEWGHLL